MKKKTLGDRRYRRRDLLVGGWALAQSAPHGPGGFGPPFMQGEEAPGGMGPRPCIWVPVWAQV